MSEWRDPSTYRDFDELMERLDAIVGAVRAKDVTIEDSLDLLEEGIQLGIRATDLVERPDFTARERASLEAPEAAGKAEDAPGDAGKGTADAADADAGDGEAGDSAPGDGNSDA